MTGIKHIYNSERGSVVLMAVFLVFFISVLMITIEMMRLSDLEIITNHIEDMQAYYCAEAGIEYQIRKIRNDKAQPATAAPGVACPTNPWPARDCILGNVGNGENPGWWFKFEDRSEKADPNYIYCNYEYITSIGCKGAFVAGVCSGTFARSVRAVVKRTNQSKDLRYIQIIRWREL